MFLIEFLNMEGIVRRVLRFMVLFEKTWKSNHIDMKLQKQHFLLCYFKTRSDGPAGVELTTSHVTAWCLPTEAPVRGSSRTLGSSK